MTINLTISSDSAEEFFTQLTEVAAGFAFKSFPALDPIMPEVKTAQAPEPVAETPKRTRRTAAQIAADNEAAAGNVASAAEVVESKSTVGVAESITASAPQADAPVTSSKEPATTSNSESAAGEGSETATGKPLDFDRDVAPVVLGYVKHKGKAWVVGILNQFGVERASELKGEREGELAELVAVLKDEGGELPAE